MRLGVRIAVYNDDGEVELAHRTAWLPIDSLHERRALYEDICAAIWEDLGSLAKDSTIYTPQTIPSAEAL